MGFGNNSLLDYLGSPFFHLFVVF